ncbi:MAG TPA: DUF3307 domain-containing protein [Candidatus Limnocylindrales bacterium]|nr:DUF3307 domain-containing protein [Candidatus Limnocylindrales bacterium]
MSDAVTVVAWLVVAHLVADFVLQTGRMAVDKQGDGGRAWRALRDHSAGVAVALVPVVVVFGLPGLAFLVLVTASHALVDRTKVLLARRAEARALAAALARYGTLRGAGGLGTAWTPVPAALFVVDQLVHGGILVAGWALLLRDVAPTDPWLAAVRFVTAGLPDPTIRAVGLDAALGVALAIVNVRAASLLIGTLVSPREVTLGRAPVEPGGDGPGRRSGPASADPGGGPEQIAERPLTEPTGPARIGEAIGVLERLLVVTFVLTGQLAAIGFVVAAKTLARFKQLDDRAFAEYYLLGTLASVSVALGSALLAAAAMAATP